MLKDTGRFKLHDILCNKNGFVIARGYWDGGSKMGLACRWHEEDGLGYPQTFGKPQWMALPGHAKLDISNALDPEKIEVSITI